MHGLEAEYWGRIDFVYLDREAAPNAAVVERFGITYQPVFILTDAEGNEVDRWFGALSPEDFREKLDSFLATAGG